MRVHDIREEGRAVVMTVKGGTLAINFAHLVRITTTEQESLAMKLFAIASNAHDLLHDMGVQLVVADDGDATT